MGGILRVPFIYTDSLRTTLEDLKARLAQKGRTLKVYASALHNKAVMYNEAAYDTDTVVIVGNEANGVTPEMISYADECIYIPMDGRVESLNAAVAAALIMYRTVGKV